MPAALSSLAKLLFRAGAVLIIANEIRGFILAAPILFAMYEAGGTLMALWVGICSLGGIALSVIVPVLAAKKLRRFTLQRVR